MKYSNNTIIYKGSNNEASIQRAKDFIERYNLTKEDIKFTRNNLEIHIITIRDLEI